MRKVSFLLKSCTRQDYRDIDVVVGWVESKLTAIGKLEQKSLHSRHLEQACPHTPPANRGRTSGSSGYLQGRALCGQALSSHM